MKQRIAIYGDCQAQSLCGLLRRSSELSSDFDFALHFTGDQHRDWRAWEESLSGTAGVFIQSTPTSHTHPAYRCAYLFKRRIVTFPSLSFPSLWPFSTAFGGADPQADAIRTATAGSGLHADALLGALRPIKDHTQRFSAYNQLDSGGIAAAARLISRRDPIRLHEMDAHRLQRMDERHETNIGRYILRNFRNRRLFHILRHPAVELTRMIGRELLQKFTGKTLMLDASQDDAESEQIPVHPTVAKQLGVQWVLPGMRYQFHNEWFSFESYAMRYMSSYDKT